MARTDVYLNINASSPADAVVTAQQDMTARDFPELVLGDAPLFSFYFTDNTASWPSWAGNAAYSFQWALAPATGGEVDPLTNTTEATEIVGGWQVRLPLNTTRLVNQLSGLRVSQEYPVVPLWQQIRVLDSDGNPVSYAVIRTNVRLRALTDSPTDDPATNNARNQAVASAAAAAASALAASNSASAASTSASNAATSESNAANSESAAAQSAQDAKDSATAAAASEVNAAASESAAAASETAAETAQGLAEAAAASASAIAAQNVYALTMTRRVSDFVVSDGGTTNRRIEWTPGTAGAVAAMPITIPFEFDVPTTNPAVSAIIACLGPIGSGAINTQNNALALWVGTTGTFILRQQGATGGTDFRDLTWSGFRSAYSGLRVRGAVVFESANSTTSPKIYVQGSDVTSSFSANSGGTVPNWMPTTLDSTKFVGAYNWPSGRFVPHSPEIGAWSATEVLAWTQSGQKPTWSEMATGSMVATYTSDFSAGVDGWVGFNATLAGNIDGIGSQDNNLRATLSGGNVSHLASYFGLTAGRRYRVEASVYIPSSNAASLTIGIRDGAATSFVASTSVEDSWVDLSGTFTAGDTQARIGTNVVVNSDGDVFYIRNVRVYVLGPIFKPRIQQIAVVEDGGSNFIPGVIVGHTPVTDRRDWVIQANTTTSGNQQLLGASPFFDHTKHVLDDWVVNNKGSNSRTISLGSASGGSQYLSGGTAAVGRNYVTLVTRIVGANALWCNSNGTDSLQHTVRGHVVD